MIEHTGREGYIKRGEEVSGDAIKDDQECVILSNFWLENYLSTKTGRCAICNNRGIFVGMDGEAYDCACPNGRSIAGRRSGKCTSVGAVNN